MKEERNLIFWWWHAFKGGIPDLFAKQIVPFLILLKLHPGFTKICMSLPSRNKIISVLSCLFLIIEMIHQASFIFSCTAKDCDLLFMTLSYPRLKSMQNLLVLQGMVLIRLLGVLWLVYIFWRGNSKVTNCQSRSVRMEYHCLGLCWL